VTVTFWALDQIITAKLNLKNWDLPVDFFSRLTADDVLNVEKGYLAERLVQEQAYGKVIANTAEAKASSP